MYGYFRVITPIAEEREARSKQLKQQRILKKERQRRNAVTDISKDGQVTEGGVSDERKDGKDAEETDNNVVHPASNDQTQNTEPPSDVQTNGQGDGQSKTKTDRYESVRKITIGVCLLISTVYTLLKLT